MRITVLAGPLFPVPALKGGAMQKSWHGLAREFARAGHQVTVVTKSYPGQPARERREGLDFVRTRGYSQGTLVAWDLVKDLLYAVNVVPRLPPADVLVTNDFWVPVLAGRFRSAAGAVVVSAGRFPKGQYGLYRGAARIAAISSSVKEAILAQQPALADRTVVIPLPVDLDRFLPRLESVQNSSRTLRYIGRIHPEKGIELLLGAWAKIADSLPEWRLQLVGPELEEEGGGGERFATAMRDRARAIRIDWRGPVWEPTALAALYASADLFCYPSLAERGEAFGVAALESMAAGVAPIVSDLACFRDFVRDGENGWAFDHRGATAEARLAEVLARAMEDNVARLRAGAAARQTAERFSLPAVARTYLAEFETIVQGRSQR